MLLEFIKDIDMISYDGITMTSQKIGDILNVQEKQALELIASSTAKKFEEVKKEEPKKESKKMKEPYSNKQKKEYDNKSVKSTKRKRKTV